MRPLGPGGVAQPPANAATAANDRRKGRPFARARERSEYLLEDFEHDDYRNLVHRLLEYHPEVVCEQICVYWAEFLEVRHERDC